MKVETSQLGDKDGGSRANPTGLPGRRNIICKGTGLGKT